MHPTVPNLEELASAADKEECVVGKVYWRRPGTEGNSLKEMKNNPQQAAVAEPSFCK